MVGHVCKILLVGDGCDKTDKTFSNRYRRTMCSACLAMIQCVMLIYCPKVFLCQRHVNYKKENTCR